MGNDFLFGCCLVVRDALFLLDKKNTSHQVSVPYCYCIMTHYPFFSLFFDFLYSLLTVLKVERLKMVGFRVHVRLTTVLLTRGLASLPF